jgi:uncharacterized membrane protein
VTLASITIPASPWVWPTAVLLLVTSALLIWSYRRADRIELAHRIAFGLKLLGISILALCLFEPLWSGRRAKSGANILVIAADSSGSMTVRDSETTQSRGQVLQEALRAGQLGWLATLGDDFQVRSYLFDSRLRRTSDFSDLTFDGKATGLETALRTLAERYKGRPLAGILLMTDGCATDTAEQLSDLSDLPPVYPVVIGGPRPQRDLCLAGASASQTAFEDAPVTIRAEVEAAGYAGRTVAVSLLDESGALVERQPWKVARNEEKRAFRFRLRPSKAGLLFYRLRVGDDSLGESEATTANNARTVVVDRGRGPYRVLYVTGRPNWDFKFLKRAVDEDEQVQLVALLRVAKREPKYDWRGHAAETSNPLYRGFDAADQEQTESYDQPVLVRLNTRDQAELREGFPKTREALFEYQAVVLDDVEAEFFTRDQMDLLRRFVTERGGGLLMLGGSESFQRGHYQRTPLESLVPVYLDSPTQGPNAASIRLQLTREGWLQPWARLRDNEKDEQQRLSEMPDFRVLNRLGRAKPGARTIGVIGEDTTGSSPALVVQRLGNGHTAALAIGDVWRWGMQNPQTHEDMDKFWRQLLRWLVAEVPSRISIQAHQESAQMNQAVTLRVRVRDRAFEPTDNASVALEVQEPDGRQVSLTAAPVPAGSGAFEAVYVPRVSGGFIAKATVADAEAAGAGEAQVGWTADLEAREFQSVKANRALLEEIARRTGGRVVEIGELEAFARALPRRSVPIMEVWIRPVWDLPGILPALFLLVLACFIAEWALRRRRGLP